MAAKIVAEIYYWPYLSNYSLKYDDFGVFY